MQIIECVPNFSEGRNETTISAIAQSIKQVAGVNLLHIDTGYAANRTVFTFVGKPTDVVEAAFLAIKTAANLIDMQQHTGEHPRIGATDVCPLIPIANISMQEVVEWSNKLAKRVADELKIPVYLYENSQPKAYRKNLAAIRQGEYEALPEKLKNPQWLPDFGLPIFNKKAGATVIGARNFLIAYNVNLFSQNVEAAKQIAKAIRESGYTLKQADGSIKQIKGKLKSVKAIGWYIQEYNCAQVSMNLTDFKTNGLHQAYEAVSDEAEKNGIKVNGSELIGLLPMAALLDSGYYFEQKYQLNLANDEQRLKLAVEKLGLNSLKPFVLEERIIEKILKI